MFDLIFGFIWLFFAIVEFVSGDFSDGIISLFVSILCFRIYFLEKGL